MNTKVLGAAFLTQAVTSLASGSILLALVEPGDIGRTMINIADNALLMRANIFGEMITALGIIFLGAVLFVALRKQNEAIALAALGLYVLEAGLLAVSRIAAFALLRVSEGYVAAGQPASMRVMGELAFGPTTFGYTLAMLPFGVGAMLFYYLLYGSGLVPRALSLWGLLTVPLVLIGTLSVLFGNEVPFLIYLPYVPFEFTVGIWFLVSRPGGSRMARSAALIDRAATS